MPVRSTGSPGTGRRNLARRSDAVLIGAALIPMIIVGCGFGGKKDEAAATAPATTAAAAVISIPGSWRSSYGWSAPATPPAGAGGATQARTATVTIDNFAFDPADATFRVGQTVTVVNKDSAPHSWTSSAGGFDTGILQPGESGTVTLKKAGTFDVVCTLHPNMTGTITVQG